MFRHCLIHAVTPLLLLLAPLFQPFFSPVRGLRSALTWQDKALTFLVFSSDFACRAGLQKSFSPVIRAKTGALGRPGCPRASGLSRESRYGDIESIGGE
jgi:hypothetical protein